MYFPYLRGKQFELLALRESLDLFVENGHLISPIIEPVKKNASTLIKTLMTFHEYNINYSIILNPQYGDLVHEEKTRNDFFENIKSYLSDYKNFQFAFIISSIAELRKSINFIKNNNLDGYSLAMIHSAIIDEENDLEYIKENKLIKYNIIELGKTNRRYHRNFDRKTIVPLDDSFNALSKNADYLKNEDEPFSEEHLFYKDDGFIGFADYLTIGDSYSETGFLPYAVAIHLTYEHKGKIRIHHFVSDTNDDISDVGGKFYEAIEKLVKWVNLNNIKKTKALIEFENLYTSRHFPGLGYVKKLSIKHHLELMIGELAE